MNLLVMKEKVGKQFDDCIRNQEGNTIYKIQSINLNLSTSRTESVVRLQNKGWCTGSGVRSFFSLFKHIFRLFHSLLRKSRTYYRESQYEIKFTTAWRTRSFFICSKGQNSHIGQAEAVSPAPLPKGSIIIHFWMCVFTLILLETTGWWLTCHVIKRLATWELNLGLPNKQRHNPFSVNTYTMVKNCLHKPVCPSPGRTKTSLESPTDSLSYFTNLACYPKFSKLLKVSTFCL